MFENRSEKQQIMIYVIIALVIAFILAIFHNYQGMPLTYTIIAGNIEFFCIFYILYLPLKVRKKKKK